MKGFTLVEVVVTILIATITVLPAIDMLCSIQRSSWESDRALRATAVAQSVLERYIKNVAEPSASPSTDVDANLSYRIDISSGTEATANAQVHVFFDKSTVPYCSLYTVVRRQK